MQYRKIMRDEQHGGSGIVHQRSQQADDLPLGDGIQRRSRLVRNDQMRGGDQRGRDADALLLTAGQFMRILAQHILVKPHLGKHDPDALRTFRRRQIVMQIQGKADLLCHGHHRIQRRSRILEHHAHITATQIGDIGVGGTDDPPATHFDGATHLRSGWQQPHHGLGNHGFAGTRRADQSDALAVGDIQIDMADDCFAADDDGEIADGYAHATSLNAGLTSGSMASRRASPNRFNAMTTSVTTRPGHTTANGWMLMNRTDVARECPQLGTPAPTPTPR